MRGQHAAEGTHLRSWLYFGFVALAFTGTRYAAPRRCSTVTPAVDVAVRSLRPVRSLSNTGAVARKKWALCSEVVAKIARASGCCSGYD